MTALRENAMIDLTPYKCRQRLRIAELVDAFGADNGRGNVYLVAQSQALRKPDLITLWQDMVLDEEWFDSARWDQGVALWMGPAGTVTPLHYDLQHALLGQFYGIKRVLLASPEDTSYLYPVTGQGYSRVDPERPDYDQFPDLERTRFLVAELGPGDALYLPWGWWHHVRGLTDSISLSLGCLAAETVGDVGPVS